MFVAAGICLSSRCLEINVSSAFTIPDFGRHIKIFMVYLVTCPAAQAVKRSKARFIMSHELE
jgi:hypothetical protein